MMSETVFGKEDFVCVNVYSVRCCTFVCLCLRLRQRAHRCCAIGRVQEARGYEGEG